MPNPQVAYHDDGLPRDDCFYVRKTDQYKAAEELELFSKPVKGRVQTTPAVKSSRTYPQPIYTGDHWGSMSGWIFSANTSLAAGFKYHAWTNRIEGDLPNRFEVCQDHGGRIHTAEEMQATFVERAERSEDWYTDKFGDERKHTKDWLQSYFTKLAGQATTTAGASSSSSSSAEPSKSELLTATVEGFKCYLKAQGCSDEYTQAQLVFVRSKYQTYFSDLCESEKPQRWPLENPPKNRKIREKGSGQIYEDVNECLLMPTLDDVVGVYVNPNSVDVACEIWNEYYKRTNKALPLYTYTEDSGLQNAIDSIKHPDLNLRDFLFQNNCNTNY